MKPVWVVIEEDRGLGPSVEGVFLNKEDAEAYAAKSSHLEVQESVLIDRI